MFKRVLDRFRKAPPLGPRPLPDWVKDSPVDWQHGDIAVSLENGWFSHEDDLRRPGPTKDSMSRVLFVLHYQGRQFLRLKGWDGMTYQAACFEKLRGSSTSVEDMIARRPKPKTPERIDA